MKKILHISKYYYPFRGGIEQTARDVVNSLKDEYIQKVICFNDSNVHIEDKVDNIDVIRCSSQFKLSSQSLSFEYSRRLKKIIEEYMPDIIILHYPNPFVTHFLLKYITNKTKLFVYWHLDIMKQKVLGKFFNKQNLKLIKRANRIIATSPNYIEGSKYLSMVKDKCIVIASCINEQRLKIKQDNIDSSKRIRNENKEKIICFAVGRHTEYKGTKFLIKASKYLSDKYVIYIAGTGKLTKKLKKIAKDDKKVHFMGKITDEELKNMYLASDIFCFPSITKNEAFGLALAEAMYFKLPAVTFTIPGSGVNYVSLNGVTGLEVENKNIEKYAIAISKLGEDQKRRKNYGDNAKKRVESNFLYNNFKENIKEFLKNNN